MNKSDYRSKHWTLEEIKAFQQLDECYASFSFEGNNQLCPKEAEVAVPANLNKLMVREVIRCHRDPRYFARSYYMITSPAKGKHIIDTYQKQDELIEYMIQSKRLAVLASRQTGKCFSINTCITVRCKTTGKVETITIGEFKNRLSKENNKLFLLCRVCKTKVINIFNKLKQKLWGK